MTMFQVILALIEGPGLQVPERTNDFFRWFFYGMGGIGGWVIFFGMAFVAVIWLLYDSQKRRLPATGWRIAVIVLMLLLLPAMLYRFTVTPIHYEVYQRLSLYAVNCTIDLFADYNLNFNTCDQLRTSLPAMTPYSEEVFYMGLLGGILAAVVAVGYYISFQGMAGCNNGHVYETMLGRCPECAAIEAARQPRIMPAMPPSMVQPHRPPVSDVRPKPSKPCLTYAWLIDASNNRRYDLFEGSTLIGRSPNSDIVLADPSTSRDHAKIRETNGHLTLTDLDSSSGTYLNNKRMRAPQVLQNGDRVTLGDTELQCVIAK